MLNQALGSVMVVLQFCLGTVDVRRDRASWPHCASGLIIAVSVIGTRPWTTSMESKLGGRDSLVVWESFLSTVQGHVYQALWLTIVQSRD